MDTKLVGALHLYHFLLQISHTLFDLHVGVFCLAFMWGCSKDVLHSGWTVCCTSFLMTFCWSIGILFLFVYQFLPCLQAMSPLLHHQLNISIIFARIYCIHCQNQLVAGCDITQWLYTRLLTHNALCIVYAGNRGRLFLF